jgi:acetyl-CoA acetyltransferase
MAKTLPCEIDRRRQAHGVWPSAARYITGVTDRASRGAARGALAQRASTRRSSSRWFGNGSRRRPINYPARHVGLRVGPQAAPALTLNRLRVAISGGISGAEQILLGGRRSCHRRQRATSQAPHVIRGARWAVRRERSRATPSGTRSPTATPGLPAATDGENLAEQYGLSRAVCDAVRAALRAPGRRRRRAGGSKTRSRRRMKSKKGGAFAVDEHPRPQSTPEAFAKLAPVFKKGFKVVTAGNASGIDGRGAFGLRVARSDGGGRWPADAVRTRGWDPKIKAGIGAPAIARLPDRSGPKPAIIDPTSVHRFAPQYLAVEKGWARPRAHQRRRRAIAPGHAGRGRASPRTRWRAPGRGAKRGIGRRTAVAAAGIAVLVEASTVTGGGGRGA